MIGLPETQGQTLGPLPKQLRILLFGKGKQFGQIGRTDFAPEFFLLGSLASSGGTPAAASAGKKACIKCKL